MNFETISTRYGFNRDISDRALTHEEVIRARQPFYDDVIPNQASLKTTLFALLLVAFILTIPGASAVLIFAYDVLAGTQYGEHAAVQAALAIFLGGIALVTLPILLVRQKRMTLDKKYNALRNYAYLSQSISDSQLQMTVYSQLQTISANDPILQRYINDVKALGRDFCLGEINALLTHHLHCAGIDTARYSESPEEQLRALTALVATSIGDQNEPEHLVAI